jgi:hypothetical protein
MAIRDYLFSRGQASLQDIARHFHVQESAMEQMLTFWLNKGTIQQLNLNNNNCTQGNCSDCFACPPAAKKIYCIASSPAKTIPIQPVTSISN